MRGMIWTVAEDGLWVDLVPLVNALPVDVRPRVAETLAALEPGRLDHLVRDAVSSPHGLATLQSLASEMKDADRARVIDAIDSADSTLAG